MPGRFACCPTCAESPLTLIVELWDRYSKVIVGTEDCPACGSRMLFSRKPTKEERLIVLGMKMHQQIFPVEVEEMIEWP